MGTKDERADIIANRLIPQDFEVCITSYEICLIEKSTFKKFSFEYIVIDEAHHIKNVDSILSQIIRFFISRGRLLITGTPLQNSLKELFALLKSSTARCSHINCRDSIGWCLYITMD
jgi:SWI/SNF-related matrix-associated actin-dependent regulator of chromatin subfamily A member 5